MKNIFSFKNFFLFSSLIAISTLIYLKISYKYAIAENNDNEFVNKIAILGSGTAGLSSAIYAGRAKLSPVLIEGDYPGGQLIKAGIIENWPGISTIAGSQLAQELKMQATDYGTKFINGNASKVDFSKRPFKIYLSDGTRILANSVIIATGRKPRKLNCPGEDTYLSKGLAVCALCDAPIFKNKKVALIGGNISALREIEILTKYTKDIVIINREPEIKGPSSWLNRLKENKHIKIMNNTIAKEIIGNDKWVTGVKIVDKKTNKEEIIPVQGVFVCIGWDPSSDLFEKNLELDSKKQIKVFNQTHTSIPGVFAAGDVTNITYHQAPVASSFGYMAAMDAEKFVSSIK